MNNKNLQEIAKGEHELNQLTDNLKSKSHHILAAPISMKNSNEEIAIKAERSKSLDHIDFERIKRPRQSLISIGDINGVAIPLDNNDCRKNGKWYSTSRFESSITRHYLLLT